jgi:hypothetical protein
MSSNIALRFMRADYLRANAESVQGNFEKENAQSACKCKDGVSVSL